MLRKVFGVDSLRDGQQAVIDSVLAGRDTLVIMPTGGGKSLCYQLPALLLKGTTIVVSPLISLMKDQVEKLLALDVAAVQLNSSLSSDEEEAAMECLRTGRARIVFCTPERLLDRQFLDAFGNVEVALVAIDEAHCISQWGHDFRPAYLELGNAVRSLGRPPLLALTATAPDDVIADIRRQLGAPDMAVINTGIYRANLRYQVQQSTSQDERQARALELVRNSEGVGIVYAATVKAVKEMFALLTEAGESVTQYHGKLAARERRQNQEMFMRGECRVMVATNAFGMGIDKNDTRFVIHLQMPSSLDAYYQESGRAGRDGKTADCTLLFLQDDKRIQQFFLARHAPGAEELSRLYQAALELNDAATGPATFTFEALQQKLGGLAEGRLETGIRLLRDGHLLHRNRKLEYRLARTRPTADVFATLEQIHLERQQHDREALETMVNYAQSGRCRWKLLLDYFGDGADFEQCCTCDNCVSPPVIAQAHGDEQRSPISGPARQIASQSPATTLLTIGSAVKVAKYDVGTVIETADGKITIEFPDRSVRTFLQAYVKPARSKPRQAPVPTA